MLFSYIKAFVFLLEKNNLCFHFFEKEKLNDPIFQNDNNSNKKKNCWAEMLKNILLECIRISGLLEIENYIFSHDKRSQ